MSQTAYIVACITYYIISIISFHIFDWICRIIIIVVTLSLINNKQRKKYEQQILSLERDKNLIISSSILSELNKVEALVNNDKMQETYDDWLKRFDEIKDVEIPKITDKLIKIEDTFNEKRYSDLNDEIAQAEMNIMYVCK